MRSPGRLLIVVLLVASGCGGRGNEANGVVSLEDTVTSTTAATIDPELQLLAFAECMREQGIDIPDPTMDASGNLAFRPDDDFDPGSTEELIAAAEACRGHLDNVTLGFEDVDLSAVGDTLLEFSQCMRTNGFDLPDPDFRLLAPGAGTIPAGGPFGDVDFNDPAFLTALERCEDVLTELGEIGR